MNGPIEYYLVGAAVLLILSVLASKLSDRFGIPALLLFLLIGMLAGSDGPGGLYFDDPALAQSIGVIALVIILFSGGLDTDWKTIRPVLKAGLSLATLGVLLTTVIIGSFSRLVLGFSWLEGLLLGAIVSSTDAAAVFTILRSRGMRLKSGLIPLLELESGSNDPMAVFLTIALVQLISHPEENFVRLIPDFFIQMVVGGILGFAAGKLLLFLIARLKLAFDGLYPVLAIGIVFLTYGIANLTGGSGFLCVYMVGLVLGQAGFQQKRSLLRFFDGTAWLVQIAMFLTLGLLVFPSRLIPIFIPGLVLAVVLILIARPVSVWLSLSLSKFSAPEKTFLSWVGLRGAVPIILATYPKLAGLQESDLIFNVVFFVVLTSALIQGTSMTWLARRLKLEQPPEDAGPRLE